MLLLLAAALPSLLWDHDVDTAQQLRDAGIVQILVPTERLEAWKRVDRMSVTAVDLKDAVK